MSQSGPFAGPFQRVKRNIARANNYLRRKDYAKGISCAQMAFSIRPQCNNLFGKEKYELEFILEEFCTLFNTNPGIIQFLDSIKIRKRPFLQYAPGKVQHTLMQLDIIATRMKEKEQEALMQERAQRLAQKTEWLDKGQMYLDKGEFPRGKAFLRRVAETFGNEESVLTDVAKRMLEKELCQEAAELLADARRLFPRDHQAYALGVRAHIELGEMEKAEAIYKEAIKTFGGHPKTYLNLSRLYMQWNKKDKAWEFARIALEGDPELREAQEIMDKTG